MQCERLHFTHIFSRLLVYLTFFFVYLDIQQKEKGMAILSSWILFSKLPEYFIQNDGRSPFRAKGGDGEGRDTHHHQWLS